MILTIHQPEFMPWLGFLDKASLADTIVLLDNVQYRHKYFQNRNKIKDINGKDIWLNIPIIRNGKTRDIGLIKDINIDNSQNWDKKLLKTIEFIYRKSTSFKDFFQRQRDKKARDRVRKRGEVKELQRRIDKGEFGGPKNGGDGFSGHGGYGSSAERGGALHG